jgi:hypothetical protein
MFTQPVSMKVTEKQFEKDLKQPLINLEYRVVAIDEFSEIPWIVTNVANNRDEVSNFNEGQIRILF